MDSSSHFRFSLSTVHLILRIITVLRFIDLSLSGVHLRFTFTVFIGVNEGGLGIITDLGDAIMTVGLDGEEQLDAA